MTEERHCCIPAVIHEEDDSRPSNGVGRAGDERDHRRSDQPPRPAVVAVTRSDGKEVGV